MSAFNQWNLYDKNELSLVAVARMYAVRFPDDNSNNEYILIVKMARHIDELAKQIKTPKCSCKVQE